MIIAFGAPIHSQASVSDAINATQECEQNPDVACPDTTPSAAEMEPQSAAVGFNAWDYIKMMLAFVVVIILLFLVLKFLKKQTQQVQQNALMQNLGGVSVGQQKSIQLVKVGNKMMLIGVGDNVQLLREVTDEEEMAQLQAIHASQQMFGDSTPYIVQLLRKWTKKDTTSSTEAFGSVLNKRLEEIKKDRTKDLEAWRKEDDHK
ncbi:MAG: flagellar biosynthetic protein FliO [Caryophanon sp.]|nr:flagellar biosynthetic protein FliO [Caryophanon sp.]